MLRAAGPFGQRFFDIEKATLQSVTNLRLQNPRALLGDRPQRRSVIALRPFTYPATVLSRCLPCNCGVSP
jgi:hypothetical protein